jgi:hypothetical protein
MFKIFSVFSYLNLSKKEIFICSLFMIFVFFALPIYALFLDDIIHYFDLDNDKVKSFPVFIFYLFYGLPIVLLSFISLIFLIESLNSLPGLKQIGEGWRFRFSVALAPFALILVMKLNEDYTSRYLHNFIGNFYIFSRQSIVNFGTVITLNALLLFSLSVFILKIAHSLPDERN